MNIAYYHASKFGNGAMVAEEFRKIMAARGVTGHPSGEDPALTGQEAPPQRLLAQDDRDRVDGGIHLFDPAQAACTHGQGEGDDRR
jgi:chitinase